MKTYKTNEIKNIAILGNDGAGKTTLTETMLYDAGIIRRRGRVSQHTTVSDYFPVEHEYGYSVFSTVCHVEWNGKKINFIDCPGSDDFAGGSITALNITDTAVILLGGSAGVEVGTQNHFRYTEKLGKPVIFLVNRLDDENLDFDQLLEQLTSIYGSKVVPIQYPVETGPNFNAIIDVLLMKKYSWGPEGGEPKVEDIPADQMDKATEMHKALIEAAAEHDESLMEKFFESEDLTEDEMREGIRKGLASRGMFPVVCVNAVTDMGVRRFMEFVSNVVPFVDEMPKVANTNGQEITPDPAGPTSLFFFKTAMEPHIGEVQYFKVMSGTVKEGDDLNNSDRGSKERIAQIFVCAGQNRIKVEELTAGDIGCSVKLKDVKTGNTLNGKDCDNRFNFIKFPNAKYSRAIRAVNESETGRLSRVRNSGRFSCMVRANSTSAPSNGAWRTTRRFRLFLMSQGYLIAKLSPRLPVPIIVTRNSLAVPVSSAKYTSSWSLTLKALLRRKSIVLAIRNSASIPRAKMLSIWNGAANSSSSTVLWAVPLMLASCLLF